MASISLGLAALIGGGLGAAGSITSGALQANAAENASETQAQEAQNALNFQEQVYGQQQQNQAPFLAAGQTSIGQLMTGLGNGTFGPGTIPSPGAFQAPTLAQAQNYPGFQFAEQQGDKGILEAAAASGGAISGGTAKSLEAYNQNLANTSYGNEFNQALSTYQAGLAQYGSQLAGQQQAFTQLATPAAIGEGATAALNNTGTSAAQNVGSLMAQIGNAQAAGTIGSTNAITTAIGSGTNGLSNNLLLSQLLPLLAPQAVQQPSINTGANLTAGIAGNQSADLSSLLANPPG